MAANGSVEERYAAGELDDITDEMELDSANTTLKVFSTLQVKEALADHLNPNELASRLAVAPWITSNNNKGTIGSSTAPLTLCSQDDPRRKLRIDRSGSTESVVTTSGGDSSGSEPCSPSRPATPHLAMAPVQTYECLRADSEDSGLGPSPAKCMGPTSPETCSVSSLRFLDDRSDSLYELSPRTNSSDDLEADNNACCANCQQTSTAIPQLTPSGGSNFQFLLASKNSVNKNEENDLCIRFPTNVTDSDEHVDEEEDRSHYQELESPSPSETYNVSADCNSIALSGGECIVSQVDDIPQDYVQNSILNPKVVLIRSDFGGQYAEESCSQQSSSAGTEATVDCPTNVEDGACKWQDCDRSADDNTTATDLLDHLRQCHVQSQPEDAKSFACLWVGCKVYSRPSCSRSWLERHVLLHGGSKPFRCIVAGCPQRFGTEVALQRHVNSHFPQHQPGNNPNQNRLHRSRRKNYKHRRRPQSQKSKDFFDDATMEYVRHNLFQLSSIDGMVTGGPPTAITFHSTVKARRISDEGKVNILLQWSPENMVPDTWVTEDELCYNLEKTIPVSQLPHEALQLPVMDVLRSTGILPPPGKRKRK